LAAERTQLARSSGPSGATDIERFTVTCGRDQYQATTEFRLGRRCLFYLKRVDANRPTNTRTKRWGAIAAALMAWSPSAQERS
jgi:hypothetical protein